MITYTTIKFNYVAK